MRGGRVRYYAGGRWWRGRGNGGKITPTHLFLKRDSGGGVEEVGGELGRGEGKL